MLNKGFLGPIGDDLPSLIPLLFALLIFFSTFTFSYNVFSKKNADFAADLDVLNISRVLKGTNYVSSQSDFFDSCNSINPTNLGYYAFITNFFTATENYCGKNGCDLGNLSDVKIFAIQPYILDEREPEQVTLKCPQDGSLPDGEFFRQNKYISKIYPLVVEEDRVVKPMHLVVIAWQK